VKNTVEVVASQPKKDRRRGIVICTLYQKGAYGFLAEFPDRNQRFFHLRDCPQVPNAGDLVTFIPSENHRGATALDVRIEAEGGAR
jgi:hypothetical protein